jgi:hypothetical protein
MAVDLGVPGLLFVGPCYLANQAQLRNSWSLLQSVLRSDRTWPGGGLVPAVAALEGVCASRPLGFFLLQAKLSCKVM